MKHFNLFSFLTLLFLISCNGKRESTQILNGNENYLPDELKGIKLYDVSTNDYGGVIKIAILPNYYSTSLIYSQGKNQNNVILLQPTSKKIIEISEIISENDSIIVCKKNKKK